VKDSRALKQLKKLPLLECIDPELWTKIGPLISFSDVGEGCHLFSAGEQSENLYVIVDGELGLYMPCVITSETFYLQSRKKGDTAGDFAVLNGGKFLVSAIAIKKSTIAEFPRSALDQLSEIDSRILASVYDAAAVLSRKVTLASAYQNLFGDVSTSTMNELLEQTEIRQYNSGEVLFEEGDPPDGLYITVSGKLVVEKKGRDGKYQRMAHVKAPETVGELALLDDTNRSASVTAARQSAMA